MFKSLIREMGPLFSRHTSAENCLARKTADSTAANFSASPNRVSGCEEKREDSGGQRGIGTRPREPPTEEEEEDWWEGEAEAEAPSWTDKE